MNRTCLTPFALSSLGLTVFSKYSVMERQTNHIQNEIDPYSQRDFQSPQNALTVGQNSKSLTNCSSLFSAYFQKEKNKTKHR